MNFRTVRTGVYAFVPLMQSRSFETFSLIYSGLLDPI